MALQAASTALDRASRADAQVKESSWAEMVRNQDRQRKELPWKPTVFVPPTVVSLKERKARERDVDVLTQTFRDPARESMVATSRDAFEAKLLARRDDLKKNRFNIINHDGPPRRIDADPSFALTRSLKDRGKPYNLLSHLQRDDHQAVPLRYLGNYPHLVPRYIDEEDPFDKVERMKKPKPRPDFNRDPGRDYDILSTKFKRGDEEKQQAIREATLKRCTDKYWKTHDYDFLKVAYLDAAKEAAFAEAREAAKKTHGQAQLARHPPVVQYSEGQNYNIINNVVTNEERLRKGARLQELRALARMKKTAVEDAAALTGDAAGLLAEERRRQRVTYKSFEGPLERGYSFINNAPLGAKEAPVYLPQPEPALDAWARLSVQLPAASRPENKVDMYASGSDFFGPHTGTGASRRRPHTAAPAPVPVRPTHRDVSGNDGPSAVPPRSSLLLLRPSTGVGTHAQPPTGPTTMRTPVPVPALNVAAAGHLNGDGIARGAKPSVRTGGGLANL